MRLLAATVGAALLLVPTPVQAQPAHVLFRLADPRITEASGLALGHRGVVYVQNDSGDTNRFFAVDRRTGVTAATITVTGARNVDWEDLAVARGRSGRSSVWIADVGDNDAVRDEVQVYRVPEPEVARTDRDRDIRTPRAEMWRLRYPSGPVNAESLAVSPDGTAYIVTKSLLGNSTVYRLPPRPDRDRLQTLERVGAIDLMPHGTANPFGAAGELAVTGAALSPDGRVFGIRTYAEAYLWRVTGGDLAAALERAPIRLPLPQQPLGEGIALTGTSTALIGSEGVHSAVYSVPLPNLPSPPRTQKSSPGSAARTPLDPEEPGTGLWWALAGVAGVAALIAAVWAGRRGRIGACRSPRSTRH